MSEIYPVIMLVLAIGNTFTLGFVAFMRLQWKANIFQLTIQFQEKITAVEKNQAESAKQKYARIAENEKRIEEVNSYYNREIALLKEGKKTLAEKIEKIEDLLEKQSLKIDGQAEVMIKIYEIVSKGKQ